MSGQEGWGGNSPKLHWLRDGRALCGARVRSGDLERDATEKYVIDFGCWTCQARLARRKGERTL